MIFYSRFTYYFKKVASWWYVFVIIALKVDTGGIQGHPKVYLMFKTSLASWDPDSALKKISRAGEKARQLKAHALPEDLGSVSRTHMEAYKHV